MTSHHIKEFSRHAHTYDEHTFVQKEVAKHLVMGVSSLPARILDLGCGCGEVYKNITWPVEHFVGVDYSDAMSAHHPTCKGVRMVHEDFESPRLREQLTPPYDLVISSSALQWARDLEAMIGFVSSICHEGAFAIFTDKTFQTIYELSGLKTFLPNASELVEQFETYFICKSEIKTFRLFFEDTLSLFRYIKKSGVSGGEKKLTLTQMRALMANYPHLYLEFEVLFVWGVPRVMHHATR